jgi:poly(beta-D-mannuronate) C5 epimerase
MFNYILSIPAARLALIVLCSFFGLLVSVVLLLSFPNFAYSQFSLFSSQWTHESSSPPPSSSFQSAAFSVPIKETRDAISSSPSPSTTASSASCIRYDPSLRVITIACGSERLTDINNNLHDNTLLTKESSSLGVWLLSVSVEIAKGATLNIDSTDTKWLKISSLNAEHSSVSPSRIDVHGSLKIDSVKITSWDPTTNNYAITNGSRYAAPPGSKGVTANGYIIHLGAPRAFIKVETDATGTTDITNSEIAYLGYEGGSTTSLGNTGLNYYGGDGSILRGNNIHDLYFGFYSRGVGHITIENNIIRDNSHYGLDPHTGTHDMIIRNNTVYGNNGIGIICSLDCYNILIENNKVHDNLGSGIMFSRNMTNSIARNNSVFNEDNGIFVSQSYNNQIYKNIVSSSTNGINVGSGSSDNEIHDNTLTKSSSHGISVSDSDAAANTIYSNIMK